MDPENQKTNQSAENLTPEGIDGPQPSTKTNWTVSFIFLISGVLIGAGIFWINQGLFSQRLAQPTTSPNPTSTSNKVEISSWYTVAYPDNFYINSKTYNYFEVADNKFLGNFTHIPTAQILVYTNVIPVNMSLNDWLNGVGNPNPPVGPVTNPKSCKDFIIALKDQLKFGDLFNSPYPYLSPIADCIYLGVSNIKPTTVNGIPALQFSTEAVSSGSTHTILKLINSSGVTGLVDIGFSLTGQSGSDDRTADAYNSFISTFKPKDQQ